MHRHPINILAKVYSNLLRKYLKYFSFFKSEAKPNVCEIIRPSIINKIPASALFIVIVIALVIGILCSSLLLIGYHYKMQVYDNNLLKKLESNANSGISFLLAEKNQVSYEKDSVFDLYGDDSDSVLMKKMHWGLYDIGMVRSFAGGHAITKIWMYGYQPGEADSSAIYLVDFGRPLSVSGTTFIKGDCFLPEAGVKRAYIEGQSFSGENLVNGTVKKSNKTLPSLNKVLQERIAGFLNKNKKSATDTMEVTGTLENDTIIRSFLEPGLLIRLSGAVNLSGKVLSGNITIMSDTTVRVDSTCMLNDILIFATGVKIENGFKGSLQVFAKDSISVGENCELRYPTALGLFKIDFQTMQPFIKIGKNTQMMGMILSHQEVTDLRQTLISLEAGAVLDGQIYADGFLDIKGNVYGNVTCNKFILKTPSTVYENHLLNATIDRSKLSAYYAGSAILPTGQQKKIIRFLE
jgi:hypothetical protein